MRRLLPAVAALAALTGCASSGPPPHPAATGSYPPRLPVLNPATVAACANSHILGTQVSVMVAFQNPPRYEPAGVARWHTGPAGTSCADYTWLVMNLDPQMVARSDVCTQFGCRLSTVLSAPEVALEQVPSATIVDTTGAVVTVTTLAVAAGAGGFVEAWMAGYAAKFDTPDRLISDNT